MGNTLCYNKINRNLSHEISNLYYKTIDHHYGNYEFYILTDIDIDDILSFCDGKRFFPNKGKLTWILKLKYLSVYETLMRGENLVRFHPNTKEFISYKYNNFVANHKLIIETDINQSLYKKYYDKYLILLYIKELINAYPHDILNVILELYILNSG